MHTILGWVAWWGGKAARQRMHGLPLGLWASLLIGVLFLGGLASWMEAAHNREGPRCWADPTQPPPQELVFLEGTFLPQKLAPDLVAFRTSGTIVYVRVPGPPPEGFLRVQGMTHFMPAELESRIPAGENRSFYLAAGEAPESPWMGLLMVGGSLLWAGLWLFSALHRHLIFSPAALPLSGQASAPCPDTLRASLAGKFLEQPATLKGRQIQVGDQNLTLSGLKKIETGHLFLGKEKRPALRLLGPEGLVILTVATQDQLQTLQDAISSETP